MRIDVLFLVALRLGLTLFLSFLLQSAHADSATWSLNPTNDNWNTAANWTPATVPNSSTAIATFGTSSITDVFLSGPIQVGAIVFNPGASAYAIAASPEPALRLMGAGIVNNSGIVQNFVSGSTTGAYAKIAFYNSATAGEPYFLHRLRRR